MDEMIEEKDKNIELENKVSTITSDIIKSPGLIHELEKPALVKILNQLRIQYQELEKEKEIIQNTLKQAKDYLEKYAILKKDHKKLEEAHIQQSKYIQKINHKINQIKTYENTIETQEKVIFKMQNILENNVKANGIIMNKPLLPKNNEDYSIIPTPPTIDKESINSIDNQELVEAKDEINSLKEQIKDLQHELQHNKHTNKNNNDDVLSEKSSSTDEDVLEELKEAQQQIDQLEAEVSILLSNIINI